MPKSKDSDRLDRIEKTLEELIEYINQQVELNNWGADTFEEKFNG